MRQSGCLISTWLAANWFPIIGVPKQAACTVTPQLTKNGLVIGGATNIPV
jgi:hypothetical protein